MRCLLLLSIFCAVLFVWTPLAAQTPAARTSQALPQALSQSAQKSDSLVRLSREEARTFSTALAALALRAQVVFVAEGAPLKPEVAETALTKEVADASSLPLSTAVEYIAALYDYGSTRSGNMFVFKKRYSDPRDLPAVTLEEARRAAQDFVRLLQPFCPQLPRGRIEQSPLMQELLGSLTPAQWQLLKNNNLQVARMTPRQQALVGQYINYFYVQYPRDEMNRVLSPLEQISKKGAILCRRDQGGQMQFGLEYAASYPNRPPDFKAFGKPTLNGAPITAADTARNVSTALPDLGDPTEQAQRDKARAAQPAQTLETVVAALNARTGGNPRVTVDSALAPKPVTVVNREAATPRQLALALAEAYGLRVVEEKVDTGIRLRLTRRAARPANRIDALPDALRHALPAPYVRALHLSSDEVRTPDEVSAETDRGRQDWQDRQFARMRLPETLQAEAARQLRNSVEPKLATAKNQAIPVHALTEREQIALADALVADCMAALRDVLNPTPPDYVRNFRIIVLTGGAYQTQKGEPRVNLWVGMPYGNSITTVKGVGNMRYAPGGAF